jgi:hypothetical protein
MYWSSADFSGWFWLKGKSCKRFDIVSTKLCFFLISVLGVENSIMFLLYLGHDFYNIILKIKHKLYIASGSAPSVKNSECAPDDDGEQGWPERSGRAGQVNNLAPLKTDILFFFCLGQCWWTFFRARAQIVDNFRRSSFVCGNLSLLSPHFRLFQWLLSVPGSYPAGPPLSPVLKIKSGTVN